MSEKAIVCACEDVSASDVRAAIAHGFGDVESLKRYTGLGTGPCQGKSCLSAAVRLCARSNAVPTAALLPFRSRPPQSPTSLASYAGLPVEALPPPPGGGDPHPPPPSSANSIGIAPAGAAAPHRISPVGDKHEKSSAVAPSEAAVSRPPPAESPLEGKAELPTDLARVIPDALRPRAPLPERADVVIVGGGIMGLGLAWHLAGSGAGKVLVLESGYLCAGASGRNGGGVRAQWSTPTLIELAKESIAFMGHFAQELGINVWLRKGGYLFLAHDPATLERLEQGAALQRRHGLATRIVSPDEAGDLVPELDKRRFIAAAWNPDDGVVFPWPFLWGYADGARKRGAQIETFTRVTGLDVEAGAVRGVRTDRGRVRADRVVLACGAWSSEVARLAGVELPSRAYRHEIVSSEPLKPFLGPLVSMLGTGLYFSQSMRGEIVGGMGDPLEPPALNQTSSLRFLARYAQALTEVMPRVGHVKLLRQWAGCYDVTPDHSPLLGETPGVRGLLQMSGFVGHGFMMAPAVARRMAAWMGGAQDEIFERFALSRFAEGRLENESFIIG